MRGCGLLLDWQSKVLMPRELPPLLVAHENRMRPCGFFTKCLLSCAQLHKRISRSVHFVAMHVMMCAAPSQYARLFGSFACEVTNLSEFASGFHTSGPVRASAAVCEIACAHRHAISSLKAAAVHCNLRHVHCNLHILPKLFCCVLIGLAKPSTLVQPPLKGLASCQSAIKAHGLPCWYEANPRLMTRMPARDFAHCSPQ